MADSTQASGDGPTPVTIFGRTYRLRGEGDTEYLRRLADLVDGKMREVEAATGTADTTKIAILASLNLADEYLKAGRRAAPSGEREDDAERDRIRRLVTMLDEALAE
jgi:cell division protein ZapA